MSRKNKRNNVTRQRRYGFSVAEEEIMAANNSAKKGNPSTNSAIAEFMEFVNSNKVANEAFDMFAISNDRLSSYFSDGLGLFVSSKEFDDIVKAVSVFGPFMDKNMESPTVVGKWLYEVYNTLVSKYPNGIDVDAVKEYSRALSDNDDVNVTSAQKGFRGLVENKASGYVFKKLKIISGFSVLLGDSDPESIEKLPDDFNREAYASDLRYSLTAYLMVEKFYSGIVSLYQPWVEAEVIPNDDNTAPEPEEPSATSSTNSVVGEVHAASGNVDSGNVDSGDAGTVSTSDTLIPFKYPKVAAIAAKCEDSDDLFISILKSPSLLQEIRDAIDPGLSKVNVVSKNLSNMLGLIDTTALTDVESIDKVLKQTKSEKQTVYNRMIRELVNGYTNDFNSNGISLSGGNRITYPSGWVAETLVSRLNVIDPLMKPVDDFVKVLENRKREIGTEIRTEVSEPTRDEIIDLTIKINNTQSEKVKTDWWYASNHGRVTREMYNDYLALVATA